MKIEREQIIKAIEDGLKNNPSVFAFWLEGADASGLLDEYSDMDMWLDVEDGQENSIFQRVEEILKNLGELDFAYEQEQPYPQIRHKNFHIKGTPDSLLLDVCIQSHGREFEFTKGLRGEEVKIIFDRPGVIKFKEFDESQWKKMQEKRVHHLKHIFAQEARVTKMIKRGEFIDAFHFYYKFILQPLSELLRIRYDPQQQAFLKYISKDLPKDIATILENLYKVNSLDEMTTKIETARNLFTKTLNEYESQSKNG